MWNVLYLTQHHVVYHKSNGQRNIVIKRKHKFMVSQWIFHPTCTYETTINNQEKPVCRVNYVWYTLWNYVFKYWRKNGPNEKCYIKGDTTITNILNETTTKTQTLLKKTHYYYKYAQYASTTLAQPAGYGTDTREQFNHHATGWLLPSCAVAKVSMQRYYCCCCCWWCWLCWCDYGHCLLSMSGTVYSPVVHSQRIAVRVAV